ncbi:uncharacterized protein LOC108278861 [Ictalurus punctatus]|uniref:Uncharacterized protein LOC108278861 n=1 Tax=Ictalurus punctatus TaxID=7998 RepID=A0A2D0SZA3_ICTPU|nr:uncharacterized protein LOC108278861 [Ictalurus punctatus]
MLRVKRDRDTTRGEMVLVMLAVLMAGAVSGDSLCDFPPAPLYYGILGKPVYLHIPIPSNTHHFCLKKDNNIILQGKREDHMLHKVYKNGVELFSSGSVKISHCVKNHSGEYQWETFHSDGKVQCDVTFMLQIHNHHHHHHLSSPDLHSLCQPSAESQHSSNSMNKNNESLLTPDCSSTKTALREQICVDSKVFLLLCGAMAVFLTLITAVCCLTITLKTTSQPCDHSPDFIPKVDILYAEVDVRSERMRKRKEAETLESETAIYSEVAQEINWETGNQTFTTYRLN